MATFVQRLSTIKERIASLEKQSNFNPDEDNEALESLFDTFEDELTELEREVEGREDEDE